MSDVREVTVPDLGDVEAAEVIDVLVAPGDTVEPETPLITMESEKSAMDLPSPAAGVVAEIKVKVGDQIGAGDLVLTLRAEDEAGEAGDAPDAATDEAAGAADDAPAEAGGEEASADNDAAAEAPGEASTEQDGAVSRPQAAGEDADAAEADRSAAAGQRGSGGGGTHEVTVPDLGDVEAAEVIDVLVAPGDTVEPETPLITMESEKSAMDLPSPAAGVVAEIKVKVGDQIGAGDLVLTLRAEDEAGEAEADAAPDAAADEAAGAADDADEEEASADDDAAVEGKGWSKDDQVVIPSSDNVARVVVAAKP